MRYLTLLILGIIFYPNVWGQKQNEIATFLKKVQSNYVIDNNVSMLYSIDNITVNNQNENEEKGLIQYGKHFYFKEHEDEAIFFDGTFYITIDKNSKVILVEDSPILPKANPLFNSDTLAEKINDNNSFNYESSSNSYVLKDIMTDFTMSYIFSKENHYLTKVVCDFNEVDEYKQMIVSYKNISINSEVKNFYKSTYQNFILKEGNKLVPSKAYSTYKLIDNTNHI